jgi:hypothetical protein
MSDWPSNSKAAGKQSQHHESAQNEIFAFLGCKCFAKDPTTDLASIQEIKEEMVGFFCRILRCYYYIFGLLYRT